ncbi:MAG TPA: biotin synthase BioB, partial [Gaiellaceae bacterium]
MSSEPTTRWNAFAEQALAGEQMSLEQALEVLAAPDEELIDLLAAAFRVRRHHFGKFVRLNFLVNAKSGHCGEDCGYCSQSRVSTAEIPRHQLLAKDELVEAAERALELKASTCCIVTSARKPSARELHGVAEAAEEIKQRHPELKLCACLGEIDAEQARSLRESGIDRYNHNLNTAASHYPEVCTTHTHADRARTVETVARAGLSPCSGLIVGLGETSAQLVEACFALRDSGTDSIPVNFLLPIEGTPLGSHDPGLDPRYCLKALCMFRLACPEREIRLAAGREVHLGSLQPLALYPANSIFVADYLTEPGQAPEDDYRMIEELGFEIEPAG